MDGQEEADSVTDEARHRSKLTLKRQWMAGATAAIAKVALVGWASGFQFVGTSGAAHANDAQANLPAPPRDGVLGFVVETFALPIVAGKDACPTGPVPRLRDAYLLTLPVAERERLKRPENAKELDDAWQAYALGPNGTNICTNPDMFTRPPMPTVKSRFAWGLNLDEEFGGEADTCPHETFESPNGEKGIDNQEYRVMGCTPEVRGTGAEAAEAVGGTRQFHRSGEWTQVLLLRGLDSYTRDDDVEVIYANTSDRPVVNLAGQFLPGGSFMVADKAPRHRNVLKGRIRDGVLTTEPADIKLAQTWGQSAIRDLRGPRSTFNYKRGRLRVQFQPDGTITGLLGGYRPVFELIMAPALGGIGSATTAGIDCAQQLQTARQMADGIRDPATGQCTSVSSAMRIRAIPAFVTDVVVKHPTAGAARNKHR